MIEFFLSRKYIDIYCQKYFILQQFISRSNNCIFFFSRVSYLYPFSHSIFLSIPLINCIEMLQQFIYQ